MLAKVCKCKGSSPPVKPQKPLLTRTTAHGVPLHALPVGERGHVSVGVHALLHVAAPHALGAAARALPADGAQGAGRAALLGAVVSCGREGQEESAFLPKDTGNEPRDRKTEDKKPCLLLGLKKELVITGLKLFVCGVVLLDGAGDTTYTTVSMRNAVSTAKSFLLLRIPHER